MYFFAGSIVIGGSLDQLVGLAAGADVEAEVVSDGESEDEPEVEAGAEAVLPEDAGDPAAEPIVPEEAQPASSSPLTAAIMPIP
ncbi:hypothetical protein ABH926_008538 [Catenulispora sp. GP43]|uniref:hypothetical protein n=1 Tax=Catenulispora sp. GP43 TaxID=3156263 RepID=UPI003518BA99